MWIKTAEPQTPGGKHQPLPVAALDVTASDLWRAALADRSSHEFKDRAPAVTVPHRAQLRSSSLDPRLHGWWLVLFNYVHSWAWNCVIAPATWCR
ncbi:hypothetical protein ACXX9E_29530 [Pseudomonas sp. GNP014]